MPCQQKVGIICERKRTFHLPHFVFPKTFQNDPFSDDDDVIVIRSNQTVKQNRTIIETISPTIEQIRPTIDQIRPTIEQIRPTFGQIRPTINQIRPTVELIVPKEEPTRPTTTVVIIEKKSKIHLRPEQRPTLFHRRNLFRWNGLKNPYLNNHFTTSDYFHSRVKK